MSIEQSVADQDAMIERLQAVARAAEEMVLVTRREAKKGPAENDCFEWPCGYEAVEAALAALDPGDLGDAP